MVTIRELAKKCGYSASTVSMVQTMRARLVKTRRRACQAGERWCMR